MADSAVHHAAEVLDDRDLAARIAAGDHDAFEALMRRYNRRLFRAARAILKDDVEAEDAVQDAYLDAYRKIENYRGDAQLATWLVRIVINHSLMRLRQQKHRALVVAFPGDTADEPLNQTDDMAEPPITTALRKELRRILERRIDELPAGFRTVFMLREVEEMSVDETADALGIPSATVRSRLFRARALLRQALARDLDMAACDAFEFEGSRCDRIVAAVLTRVGREQAAVSLHRM